MPFSLASHALIDSSTLSQFIWGVDDAATSSAVALTSQQKFSVELAVNAVSRQIMTHLSSDIKAANYTEVWDGVASDEIVTRERPINSVTSIKLSGNGDWSAAALLPTETYYFDKSSVMFRSLRTPIGRGLVQVIYNAGFSTVPDDIVLAALLQFQYTYKQIGMGDAMSGLKSVAKFQESQTKDDSTGRTGLISEVVGMLRNYERFEAPRSIMFTRVS